MRYSLEIPVGNGTLVVGLFDTPHQLVNAVQELTESHRQALTEATYEGPRVTPT
jgi:hypothetical protein